jgi:hypothetical protein
VSARGTKAIRRMGNLQWIVVAFRSDTGLDRRETGLVAKAVEAGGIPALPA